MSPFLWLIVAKSTARVQERRLQITGDASASASGWFTNCQPPSRLWGSRHTQGLVSPQLINLTRTRRRQAHLRANVANFCSLFSRPCRCIPGGLIHASICMWGRRTHAAACCRCGSTVFALDREAAFMFGEIWIMLRERSSIQISFHKSAQS